MDKEQASPYSNNPPEAGRGAGRVMDTLLKNKAYEFVPLLEKCEREKYINRHIMEPDTYSGKLKLEIVAESPVHIGSGQQVYDQDGNVIKKQMMRDKKEVIPGSSLKGAVRSIAEAVSFSCAVKAPDQILKGILPPNNRQACADIEKGLCITCSIFGMIGNSGGYKGKVHFGEFAVKKSSLVELYIPLLQSPFKNSPEKDNIVRIKNRNSHGKTVFDEKKCIYGNERLYYCKACEDGECQECGRESFAQQIKKAGPGRSMGFRGRKFYSTDRIRRKGNGWGEGKYWGKEGKGEKDTKYKMINEKCELEGEVVFQDLTEAEGKLLFYALGIGQQFTMKLGYGKPLGFGRVKVNLVGVENAVGVERYLGKKEGNKDLEESISGRKELNADIVRSWAKEYKNDKPQEIKCAIDELERIMKKREDYAK